MSAQKTEVSCVQPQCRNTFEAPKMHFVKIRALMMSAGWRMRGSNVGMVYHCPEHPPPPDR